MRTYSLKPKDVRRQWYVVDASDAPLGRIATQVASLLLGKAKPSTTAHIDGGDYVIVINAASLVVTGNKEDKKDYFRHSGFPGGLYKRTLKEQKTLDPRNIIIHAVRGMLPDNKLRRGRLARLKVYESVEHNHQGQNPKVLSLKKEAKP